MGSRGGTAGLRPGFRAPCVPCMLPLGLFPTTAMAILPHGTDHFSETTNRHTWIRQRIGRRTKPPAQRTLRLSGGSRISPRRVYALTQITQTFLRDNSR